MIYTGRTPRECVSWNSFSDWMSGIRKSRTPRECVSWNRFASTISKTNFVALHVSAWVEIVQKVFWRDIAQVALHVSAWVEIFTSWTNVNQSRSHSTWVRELKFRLFHITAYSPSRTPRECVSWNVVILNVAIDTIIVALHVSAWVEIWQGKSRPEWKCVALHVSAWVEIHLLV